MDWKTMQADLRRLEVLIEGWSQADEIPAVERDLALEKLRSLYEAIRFAAPGAGQSEPDAATTAGETPGTASAAMPEGPEEELPESLDLGAVLSLDGFPDLAETEEGPIYAEPADPFGVGGLGTEKSAPAPETETVPAAETEAVPAPEAEPAPVAATEVAPVVAAEPETVPEAASNESEEPAARVVEPESAPATPKAHPVSPTLFGMEEEMSRHRHKQRVIMSLYGPSPVPERNAEIRPTAQPSTVGGTTVATPFVEPASGDDEFSDDEVWLSEETISVTEQPAAEPPAAEPQGTEPQTPEPQAAEPQAAEPQTAGPQGAEPQTPGPQAAGPAGPAESAAPAGSRDPEPRNEAVDPDRGPGDSPSIPASGAVLGEVINHDVQTLADTIAPPHDIASELRRSEPVTDLRQAIGLNDKFLLIRDLFDGDGEAFGRALDALNGFDNLDDCMIYIAEHYAWNPNSDGAKLMMELLERKFA